MRASPPRKPLTPGGTEIIDYAHIIAASLMPIAFKKTKRPCLSMGYMINSFVN